MATRKAVGSPAGSGKLRLLVMAHTPPPHHGQSMIVQQLVEGLRREHGATIDCDLLDIRFSGDIADIGQFSVRKLTLLLSYCLALWRRCRRSRPDVIYYVPAPGKRSAVYRDWALVGLARLLRVPVMFHWLAGGLDEWHSSSANAIERAVSRKVYCGIDLSLVPVRALESCAMSFAPKRLAILSTGIPDPCPDFAESVLPLRRARLKERTQASASRVEFRALFMAHCTEDKGLFDAILAVGEANRTLAAQSSSVWVSFDVYGEFAREDERQRFLALQDETNRFIAGLRPGLERPSVRHLGVVRGAEKREAMIRADVLCFPSYYSAEVIPTVILDAMAYGLPVITTKWRGIPELLPVGALPPCEPRAIPAISSALVSAVSFADFESHRLRFLECFTREHFLRRVVFALRSLAVCDTSGAENTVGSCSLHKG